MVNLMRLHHVHRHQNSEHQISTGCKPVDVAQQLILTPQDGTDFILTLPKAATGGNFTMAYKSDDVRVFSVEFNAYPDDTGVLGTLSPQSSSDGRDRRADFSIGQSGCNSCADYTIARQIAPDEQGGDGLRANPAIVGNCRRQWRCGEGSDR